MSSLTRFFRRVRSRLNNYRSFWSEVEHDLNALTARNMRSGKDAYGDDFKPLSPLTEKLRRKGQGKGSNKPMLNTGGLARSFSLKRLGKKGLFGSNWPEKILRAHHHGAEIKAKNGKFLFLGKTNGGKGIPIFAKKVTLPARKILPVDGLSESYIRVIKRRSQAFLKGEKR